MRPPARSNKGFTLIELMIVIGIIAVLVVVLAIAILPWLSKSDENNTKTLLQSVHAAVSGNKSVLTIEKFKKDAGSMAVKIDSNDDIALAQMLLFYIAPSKEVWDNSALYKGTTYNPTNRSEEFAEFTNSDNASRLPYLVDAWGNPLVYSYDKVAKNVYIYSRGPDGKEKTDDDVILDTSSGTIKLRSEFSKK